MIDALKKQMTKIIASKWNGLNDKEKWGFLTSGDHESGLKLILDNDETCVGFVDKLIPKLEEFDSYELPRLEPFENYIGISQGIFTMLEVLNIQAERLC